MTSLGPPWQKANGSISPKSRSTPIPPLLEAVERFEPVAGPADQTAAEWLKSSALAQSGHIATYVLIQGEQVVAFYSLGMGEVELRTQHRKRLASPHPRPGAVLVLWLARAIDADVGAETILRHAVGIGQIAARHVGAAVIALDPFDAETEQFWRERFGFRASLTRRRDAQGEERPRLWMPLFPDA
ncbi:MAG: hypothetical protein ACREX8_09885 [Gammaproteobacteria bacterium]